MEGILFTKSHEWVDFINETSARIGLTDYAQESMGDLVFIDLPEEGDDVVINEPFADVESVKAVEEVVSPVEGVVFAINEELLDSPQLINEAPYEAWLIEVVDIVNRGEFLTEEEYDQFIKEED